MIDVPDGKISFPCFTDYAFYLDIEENNANRDNIEGTQEFRTCVNLAEEVTTTIQVSFGGGADVEPSIYSVTLQVLEVACDANIPLVDEDVEGLTGRLQWRSASTEFLEGKIEQDEFVDQGGVIAIITADGLEDPDGNPFENDSSSEVMAVHEEEFVSGLEGVAFEDDEEWFATENPEEWANEPNDAGEWDGTREILGRPQTKWDIALSGTAAVIFLLSLLVCFNCLFC